MAKRTTTKKATTKKTSGRTASKKTTAKKSTAKKPATKKTVAKKTTKKKSAYKKPEDVLKKVENTKRYIKGLKTKLSKNPKGEWSDSENVLDTVIEKLEKIVNEE